MLVTGSGLQSANRNPFSPRPLWRPERNEIIIVGHSHLRKAGRYEVIVRLRALFGHAWKPMDVIQYVLPAGSSSHQPPLPLHLCKTNGVVRTASVLCRFLTARPPRPMKVPYVLGDTASQVAATCVELKRLEAGVCAWRSSVAYC